MLFNKPLYEILRPKDFSKFSGHKEILENLKKPENLILWGPPGVGKTTLAYILANQWNKPFYQLSAVLSGKKDVKSIIDKVEEKNTQTIIFIDEIHAFNKSQQNIFLKHIETGLILLIGATTENPSFEIISPLLSRTKLIVLKRLSFDDLSVIFDNAMDFLKQNNFNINFYEEFKEHLINYSNGDARILLKTFEQLLSLYNKNDIFITKEDFLKSIGEKTMLYDKKYDEHYNLLSAFHKSLRGSDPDAALYWAFRMIESGEEPRAIFRRLIACASEDIGNADPQALILAVNSWQAFEFLGRPEGDLALSQAIIYIATAPKSNSVYKAMNHVKSLIKKTGYEPVPLHLRNAVNSFMKKLNYGKDYKYPHDYPYSIVYQTYLPESIQNLKFYFPKEVGFEREIKKRVDWIEKQKKSLK